MHHVLACRFLRTEEGTESPGNGVTHSYYQLGVGTQN